MAVRELEAGELGLPAFRWRPRPGPARVFDLSSHKRAREALEFGLAVSDPGFNIFVLGEDRSGRMTETMNFLNAWIADRPAADDWVYLNNFRRPHRPKPYRLKPGDGRRLRKRIGDLVLALREGLRHAFQGKHYRGQVESARYGLTRGVEADMQELRDSARDAGLTILQTAQGVAVSAVDEKGAPIAFDQLPEDRAGALKEKAADIVARLDGVNRTAAERHAAFVEVLGEINCRVADEVIAGFIHGLEAEFAAYAGLKRWFAEMRQDMIEHAAIFTEDKSTGKATLETPEHRYGVNLLVDNGDAATANLVVEANPRYENLFGRIEYRPAGSQLETDFMLIRAGALHRANGGVLVLRADALSRQPGSWMFLKGALRDERIRIEEPYREGAMPLTGAPNPKPIPLDVKVVVVGDPALYYAAFSRDPEFNSYFKVKADIGADMVANSRNLAIYAGLIEQQAQEISGLPPERGAVRRLLGMAARWAEDRRKLSARQELIRDVLSEANHHVNGAVVGMGVTSRAIDEAAIVEAERKRRYRNARIEDRMQENITADTVMIDVAGWMRGQINALSVRNLGDYAFGTPSRVTARASVGRRGVINIERQVEMGGPLQQKAAMVLQGYLAELFARDFPLSFNCSITFEQNYGGIEGDSASLAELIVVLSALADVPLRQDLAITGSVNQRGIAQSVGGVNLKVEGFFRSCRGKGLNGNQGVVLPATNANNLILEDAVRRAVRKGDFHIYTVETAADAACLFTGMETGKPDRRGRFPPGSLYGRVMARLAGFDRILRGRETVQETG